MIKEFIIFIICGIVLTLSRTNTTTFINFALNLFDTHIKVRGLKNLKNFNNKRIVIMSNHINGFDAGPIIYALSYYIKNKKKIYTIAKHNVFGDKNDKNIFFTESVLDHHINNKITNEYFNEKFKENKSKNNKEYSR